MDHKVSRRAALAAMLGTSAAACKPRSLPSLSSARQTVIGHFKHGIASGDPLQDRVVIWTRFTQQRGDNASAPDMMIEWEVAEDENFETVAKSGTAKADSAKDWTVKVDVTGLNPGSWYFYRFKYNDAVSAIGKTRTLPSGKTDKARFAVVSCSNWQEGFFNVYDHIARDGGFDALLHLGDYYYEYGAERANAAMQEAGRTHDPEHEIVELSDYRRRHALYRTDPSLQAVTASMPMISIWDDHETTNDSYKDGAQNHQPDEGDWEIRKARAMRAYYEWLPIRDPKPNSGREFLYRSFEWGDLATLAAVETRLLARDETWEFDDYYDQLIDPAGFEKFKKERWHDPSREMMGQMQVDWIARTFGESKQAGKPWRMLVNQVLLSRIHSPNMTRYVNEEDLDQAGENRDTVLKKLRLTPLKLPLYPDSWDGYPAARERFYQALKSQGVEDMLVVTGDAHEYWANHLTDETGERVGAELCTSSVTSITVGDVLGETARLYALLVTRENPDVKYYNPMTQGYIDLTLTPSKAKAKMVSVDTVSKQDYTAFRAAGFTIKPDGQSLKISAAKGLSLPQRLMFENSG